jgi:hypothetical protein
MARLSPRDSPVRSGLVAATWEGAFAQVFLTLTSGVFVVRFADRLGAGDDGLAVLTALPFLAQAIQGGTGWLLERFAGHRRGFTAWTLLLARLAWLVPAALALGLLGGAGFPVLLLSVLVSSLLATAGAHGWMSWMGDLVPAPVRGRYFGFRNAVMAALALATGSLAGLAFDALESRRVGLGQAAAYGTASLAGVLAFVAILRQHHPPSAAVAAREPYGRLVREAWRRPGALRILLFFVAWNVAIGAAAPFWVKYMDVTLRMDAAEIVLQGTIGPVVAVAMSRAWGRLVDRVGIRPVLLATAFCIATIPFYWLFARPGFLVPVWVDAVAVGVFWSGFNLAAFNLPLSVAGYRGGTVFLGMFSAVTGVALGLSCLAAGVVAEAIGPGPHDVLGLPLTNLQVMFLASGCLRLASVGLALGLPDPRAKGVVFLVQFMGYAVRQRLNLGRQLLFTPWRFRPWRRPRGSRASRGIAREDARVR